MWNGLICSYGTCHNNFTIFRVYGYGNGRPTGAGTGVQDKQVRVSDGCRNGHLRQTGMSVRRIKNGSSLAMQHALQWFPLLCGVSSAGGPQPDDLPSP